MSTTTTDHRPTRSTLGASTASAGERLQIRSVTECGQTPRTMMATPSNEGDNDALDLPEEAENAVLGTEEQATASLGILLPELGELFPDEGDTETGVTDFGFEEQSGELDASEDAALAPVDIELSNFEAWDDADSEEPGQLIDPAWLRDESEPVHSDDDGAGEEISSLVLPLPELVPDDEGDGPLGEAEMLFQRSEPSRTNGFAVLWASSDAAVCLAEHGSDLIALGSDGFEVAETGDVRRRWRLPARITSVANAGTLVACSDKGDLYAFDGEKWTRTPPCRVHARRLVQMQEHVYVAAEGGEWFRWSEDGIVSAFAGQSYASVCFARRWLAIGERRDGHQLMTLDGKTATTIPSPGRLDQHSELWGRDSAVALFDADGRLWLSSDCGSHFVEVETKAARCWLGTVEGRTVLWTTLESSTELLLLQTDVGSMNSVVVSALPLPVDDDDVPTVKDVVYSQERRRLYLASDRGVVALTLLTPRDS